MKKLLIILLFLPMLAMAAMQEPIPVSSAFQLQVTKTNTDSLLAKWNIAPGYNLYRVNFSFKIKSPKDATLGLITLPKGIEKDDEILGKHQVYANNVTIPIPVLNPQEKPLQLIIGYQGCAESGFCYPPQLKLVTVNSNNITISNAKETAPVMATEKLMAKVASKKVFAPSEQGRLQLLLQNGNAIWALLVFLGLGLLLTFTPCVLPMIPILSGIIIGHGKKLTTGKAFRLSLIYVLAMAITFAIAGVIVGFLGANIQAAMQKPWIIIIFSIVFVALSFSLFGFYELQLPTNLQAKVAALSQKQHAGHYFGVAIMGVLSTLIVSPCVSAPLVGALAYIGNTGNALFGGLALFAMGLGMGIPLLIVGTSHGKWLPKAGAWMDSVKAVFGVLMLGLAIWMLERILSGTVILFLWAALAICASIYMGALSKTPEAGWGKLWKSFGIILLVYGILMLIGAATGNTDPLQPIKLSNISQQQAASTKINYIPVKNIQDVEKQIKLAKAERKPVMLDINADWCADCKKMQATTFKDARVINALKNFAVLKADVTANDAQDIALEKKYDVIAPPSFVFFDSRGHELKDAKIVGLTGAEVFYQHLKTILTQ